MADIVELFSLEYMTALGMTMLLLFLDSRCSRRLTALTVGGVALLVMAAVAALYLTAGLDTAVRVYTLAAHLPSLLLLLIFSRFRGWRMVFQLLSAVLFCMLIQHGAGLAYYLSGGSFLAMLLTYALLTAGVICFLIRFLRPLFLQAMTKLRHGWWMMCLVMAAYYGIIAYLIPGYVGFDRMSTILKPSVSLLMVGFYSVLMSLFSSVQKEAEARHSAHLTALQLSALQSRMEAVRAAEHAIRMERHDLRHRLQAVAELVARGDEDAALRFLDAAQKRLDEKKEMRWCRPPILDAVFSSYFEQAKHHGIRVEAAISLPESLPVEEGELAIVVANSLENAIHANLELPPGQREIRCKMVGVPGVMLEISNPCAGDISFDGSGLPVTRKEGHGLGVQSISSFCKKNGAVCQFDLADSWFRFRLIL